MIRTIVKDQLTDEILYSGDFATQQQLDAWSSVRFPQAERRMEKSQAQDLHGEDYATYLLEEVLEEFNEEEVTIAVLKPLAKIETEDVSAEYTANAAKEARKQAGKAARLKCNDALDIIAGWNLERELTAEQINTMSSTFAPVLQALQALRPTTAAALIDAIEPDDVLVTQEMKEEILSVL